VTVAPLEADGHLCDGLLYAPVRVAVTRQS
jgi:hypothetical protein